MLNNLPIIILIIIGFYLIIAKGVYESKTFKQKIKLMKLNSPEDYFFIQSSYFNLFTFKRSYSKYPIQVWKNNSINGNNFELYTIEGSKYRNVMSKLLCSLYELNKLNYFKYKGYLYSPIITVNNIKNPDKFNCKIMYARKLTFYLDHNKLFENTEEIVKHINKELGIDATEIENNCT
jgi:hypothetical protein